MAIDIDALRAKLDKMNNVNNGSSKLRSDIWKPDYGKYEIRIVPWPATMVVETAPFVEKYFYYDIGKSMCAPGLNQPDPVRELRATFFENRTDENLAMARMLRPRLRTFVPIVVRGQEDEGVKIWSVGKQLYKQLIELIIDPDYGDISDINKGFDLKVTIGDSGKKFDDGRPVRDVTIGIRPKPSPLMPDKKQIMQLLDSVPNIEEIYPTATEDELTAALDRFVSSGAKGGQSERPARAPTQTSSEQEQDGSSLEAQFDALKRR